MSPSHFLHFFYVSSVIIVVWFGALRQDIMHETLVDLEFGGPSAPGYVLCWARILWWVPTPPFKGEIICQTVGRVAQHHRLCT